MPEKKEPNETSNPSHSETVQAGGAWSEPVGPWTTHGTGQTTTYVTRPASQEVMVVLLDVEKARLAEDIAIEHDAIAELEERKKDFMAAWKSDKQAVLHRMQNKVQAVRSGKERRVIDGLEVFDHESRTHYFSGETGLKYGERALKDQEYLVGQPELFVVKPEAPNVHEIRSRKRASNEIDGELVGSSEDGKATKLAKPRTSQAPREGMTVSSDVRDVMREEKNPRTKVDHTTPH